MITIVTKKGNLVETREVWFYDGGAVERKGKSLFYQSLSKPNFTVYAYQDFQSLAIHLVNSVEDILSKISRTFKYHIRKAEKLNLTFKILDVSNKNHLDQYWTSYNQFAQRKKIGHLPRWRIDSFIKSGCLTITYIEASGGVVTMHAYIHDAVRTRLLTSHTVKQEDPATTTGYSNKFHHWQDILYFKERGFVWYDFGGVSGKPDDGRNYFKQSFGGEPQVFCHFITCTGLMKWWFELKFFYERIFKRNLLQSSKTKT